MIDTVMIVMSSLEQAELKRVVQIQIEFIKDRENMLWVNNVPVCKLIEAKYTISHQLFSEKDIQLLQKSIPKTQTKKLSSNKTKNNKYYEIKQNNKESIDKNYVFTRGQIRNNESFFDSPIRINSVEPQAVEDTENLLKTENNQTTKNELTKSFFSRLYTTTSKKRSKISEFLEKPLVFSSTSLTSTKSAGNVHSFDTKTNSSPDSKNLNTKSPSEAQKWSTILRRFNHSTTRKTLKKDPNSEKHPVYDDDFIELVMKTYCRKNKINSRGFTNSFGIAPNISSEEFSRFLSTVQSPRDETNRVRVTLKLKPEENHFSKPNSPNQLKNKFGFFFVSGLLTKRAAQAKRLANLVKPVHNNQKFISKLISCPRSKQILTTSEKNKNFDKKF